MNNARLLLSNSTKKCANHVRTPAENSSWKKSTIFSTERVETVLFIRDAWFVENQMYDNV